MTLTEHIQPLLDRRLPAALVAAFLLQSAGALFWAGSAAERITVLERETESSRHAIERVAVLEEQVTAIRQTLDRIETKLDRRDEGGERTK
jgi:ubiquinone biosynthesis protein UbiJ